MLYRFVCHPLCAAILILTGEITRWLKQSGKLAINCGRTVNPQKHWINGKVRSFIFHSVNRKLLTPNKLESLRYLDWHPELTTSISSEDGKPFTEELSSEPDINADIKKSFHELLSPLLLNSALAALKLGGASNARTAKELTDRALNEVNLSNADRGMIYLAILV
jgi:hypothetical protein